VKLKVGTAGYLLALGSAAAGAIRYNLAVFARETAGFDYVAFLAYALAVGVACSAVHVWVREGRRGFVPLAGRWRHALAYGVLMAWSSLSHFLALYYLNETVMTSVSQTGILVTIGLAVWLLGERFTLKESLAAAVILVGVFLFRPWGGARLHGFLVLASGLVSSALATVGAKRWVLGIPPRTLMLWRNIVALLLVGTWTLAHGGHREWTLATVAACVATGVFGPWLHGLFFLKALERIDAAKAALMSRIQPAIVFLLSWLLLDRLPTARDRISALVLVAGAALLVLARERAPKPAP